MLFPEYNFLLFLSLVNSLFLVQFYLVPFSCPVFPLCTRVSYLCLPVKSVLSPSLLDFFLSLLSMSLSGPSVSLTLALSVSVPRSPCLSSSLSLSLALACVQFPKLQQKKLCEFWICLRVSHMTVTQKTSNTARKNKPTANSQASEFQYKAEK